MTRHERTRRRRAMAQAVANGATPIDVAIAYGVNVTTVRRACDAASVRRPASRATAYRSALTAIANGAADPQAIARKVLGRT